MTTFLGCSHVQEIKRFPSTVEAKTPCGLNGPIPDRIRDCSEQESSIKGVFNLVTRTKEFKEIYKDTKSGLLWGDRLETGMNHFKAMEACKADLDEVGQINEVSWRLPSKEEYEEANKNEVRAALPNMDYWFWTSTLNASNPNHAWFYNGLDGVLSNYNRSYGNDSVRCIGR